MTALVHRVMWVVERLDWSCQQQPSVSAVFLRVLFEFYKFSRLTNGSTPPAIENTTIIELYILCTVRTNAAPFYVSNTQLLLNCVSHLLAIQFLIPKRKFTEIVTKLTLLLAVSYISPSTFLAYATRFVIRLSLRALGSLTGVGKIAVTLQMYKSKIPVTNKLAYMIYLFPGFYD